MQFSYLENTFISLKLEITNSIKMFAHAPQLWQVHFLVV